MKKLLLLAAGASGDRVDDTPAMSVPTSGCPESKDTCVKEHGLDAIHNFMDSSFDRCYTDFTEGQAARMRAQFVHFRTGRYWGSRHGSFDRG